MVEFALHILMKLGLSQSRCRASVMKKLKRTQSGKYQTNPIVQLLNPVTRLLQFEILEPCDQNAS